MATAHGPTSTTSLELTPLRAHYLKRELVTLQITSELSHLDSPEALALLGPPFYPQSRFSNGLPQSAPLPGSREAEIERRAIEVAPDLRLLRFVFNRFVLSFPFLANCPPTFFSHKLQPLVYSFITRNISPSDDEQVEETKKKKFASKVEKKMGLIMSAAIKITENHGKEEIVRIASDGSMVPAIPSSQQSLFGLDAVSMSRQGSAGIKAGSKDKLGEDDFVINIVAVRNAVVKGRVRNKAHEEFIVRTRRGGVDEVYVTRRYGDFTRLTQTLRRDHPEQDVVSPPSKDRRTTEARVVSPANSGRNSVDLENHYSNNSNSSEPTQSEMPTLSRERNRLTLRAFLRNILSNPILASGSAFQSFLVESPIQLTQQEMREVEIREEMDRIREEEVRSFRAEVEERVTELEGYLRGFKEDLVKKDGLTRVFATIRETPIVQDLPVEYQKAIEWGRISLASTIYQLFLGSDDSSSTFVSLKRTHGMMPYFVMRQILRISNPIAMLRGILELFLARPFGSTSLLQRMFSSGLAEEAKTLKDEADLVAAKIGDFTILEKLQKYVDAPKEIQLLYQADAASEGLDIMSIILRSPEEPQLDRATMQRVQRASVAYQEYMHYRSELAQPEDDDGPDNDDAWLFEDLHVFLKIITKTRDKEQMIELIFEGSTSEVLKDMITIFYEPLAKVYKAANIADSMYDLQVFVTDLIKTVELAEEANLDNPQRTVQTFVDLVARHEAGFYNFVHQVHSKGEGLFDNLMKWIELFINFVRDGLPTAISLEFLLPYAGKQREEVMEEVDQIIEYHRKLKVNQQDKMKRKLLKGRTNPQDLVVEGDPESAFLNDMMEKIQVNPILDDEIGEDESDEDDEDEDEDDSEAEEEVFYETSTDSPIAGSSPLVKSLPPVPGQLVPIPSAKKKKRERVVIPPPRLKHIPLLVPIFIELISDELHSGRR